MSCIPLHDESKLPKWAQKRLNDLRQEVASLENLKTIHAILSDKDPNWSSLTGLCNEGQNYRNLWVIDCDHPRPVCTVGKNDVVFIGRQDKARRENQRKYQKLEETEF